MSWKWFNNLYYDMIFRKLQKDRFRLQGKKGSPERILEWLESSQRLICYAPPERKEVYWKELGGVGCLPKSLANY